MFPFSTFVYAQEMPAVTKALGNQGTVETKTPANLFSTTNPGGGWESLLINIVPILVLMILFYVLLILPQQRRLKDHTKMLNALQKGDAVITGGGLLATVDKIINEEEVLLDMGNGVKMTALRSTIQAKDDPLSRRTKPANDAPKKKAS